MKKILIHGLGQDQTSWNKTLLYMNNDENILCPNIFSLLNGKKVTYSNLYQAFKEYCNHIDGKVHLCGISLGGILALNYTLDFPNKVNSLVLIGTPYKIPKVMLTIQNIIFRFLPSSCFKSMKINKKDVLTLCNSMKILDFSGQIQKVKCSTLIICGKKDKVNLKSAKYYFENIKGAKLQLIEDIGHIVNEENPKILASLLSNFYIKY